MQLFESFRLVADLCTELAQTMHAATCEKQLDKGANSCMREASATKASGILAMFFVATIRYPRFRRALLCLHSSKT